MEDKTEELLRDLLYLLSFSRVSYGEKFIYRKRIKELLDELA